MFKSGVIIYVIFIFGLLEKSSGKNLEKDKGQLLEDSPFVASHWKIWDDPKDQIALEEFTNNGTNSNQEKDNSKVALKEENGTQRRDCDSNMQVQFFPIVLVIIATIAGLITVLIFWAISRNWNGFGHPSNSNGNGYSSSSYSSYSPSPSGWSQPLHSHSRAFPDFSRVIKNLDIDQLTNLVSKGVETYKKIVEK